MHSADINFELLFAGNPLPMWVYDLETLRFLEVNWAAVARYGYSREEFLGMGILDIRPPEDVLRLLEHTKAERPAYQRSGEWRHRSRDGEIFDVFITSHQIEFTGRKAALVVAEDITERKRAEAQLLGQNQVLELLSTGASLKEILEAAVRSIEQQVPGTRCSVLLLDGDGKHLRFATAPNLPEEFNRATDGLAIGPCAGSCGTAAYRGEVVIVEDIATDPLWSDFSELALKHGLRACWSYPIISSVGHVLGTICMYYGEPRAPKDFERRLIYGGAQLVRIAIERKRTEEMLRESEERYRELFENANDIVYTRDLEGKFTSFNKAGERLTGYRGEEALGLNIREIVAPEHLERVHEMIYRKLAGDDQTMYELDVLTKDGGRIALEVNSRLICKDGKPVGVQGIARDVTERRQALRDLEERTAFLHALIEHSPLAIVVLDSTNRIRMCNPAFEKLFLYKTSEISGADVDEFIAPPELQKEAQDISAWALAGDTRHITTRRRRKDGSLVEVELFSVPLIVGDRIVGAYAIYQDVSQRKELEEQLRQAQKIEAVGRLAGGIAHDFNNLLNVITGYSELLEVNLGPGDPNRKRVEQIYNAARRAAALTGQLLAFSRKQMLEPRVLDLNSVMADMGEMLQRLIGEHIELKIQLSPDLGCIKADRSQIEQVIMNLGVNARDAMPQGGRLSIETDKVEFDEAWVRRYPYAKRGSYVILRVTDTGVGMDPETQARIFEPFFTTKEKTKGTGLGLATVYGIVKQSDGYIWVASEPGKGTTFTICLPRVDAIETTEVELRFDSSIESERKETVLVVEDQEGIRTLAREFLEMNGYMVLEAGNGTEALRLIREHEGPVHLLLTDVVMPQMSGRELANQIVKHRPEVKVLYMSGYTDDEIIRQGRLDAGAPLVQKPFSLNGLIRKVGEVLGSRAIPRLAIPAPESAA